MNKKVLVELDRTELNLIIYGMSGSQYPKDKEKDAFNLVLKLRDKLREAT